VLDPQRRQEILEDALRMLAEFSTGSVCRDLAYRMEGEIDEVYQTPDPFVKPPQYRANPGDSLALGDHHPLSTSHPEEIHLSNSRYRDGPWMDVDDFTEVARHEFAHALGYGAEDQAEQVATLYCEPGGTGGPDGPPKQQLPMVIGGSYTPMSTAPDVWDY
jgi:hypothetical protein